MSGELPIRILADIKAKLEAISATGFAVEEVQYYRGMVPDAQAVETAFCMIRPERETIAERWDGAGAGRDSWLMKVQVFCGDRVPSGSEGDKDWPMEHAAKMRHELQKALAADIYRGGYAESTEFTEVHWFPEDLAEFDSSLVLVVDVLYTQEAGDSTAIG